MRKKTVKISIHSIEILYPYGFIKIEVFKYFYKKLFLPESIATALSLDVWLSDLSRIVLACRNMDAWPLDTLTLFVGKWQGSKLLKR